MVPEAFASSHCTTSAATLGRRPVVSAPSARRASPSSWSTDAMCRAFIRQSLGSRGLSHDTASIIMEAWRPATKKQYFSALSRWLYFCRRGSIHPIRPTIGQALNFLTKLFQDGATYSTINTSRSALSALLCVPNNVDRNFGSHPLVTKFMKGIYNLKPPVPRYSCTWDVNILLRYISTLEPVTSIPFKSLTYKLVCLCAITTGQRAQTLALFSTDNMSIGENSVHVRITETTKTTKTGQKHPLVVLSAYPTDGTLCVIRTLAAYINRTKKWRQNKTKLFLGYVSPHPEVTPSTISRWLKQSLHEAGIDTSVFKGHSVRSACTSAAANQGLTIDKIMQTAGWTRASTFGRFYHKPITGKSTAKEFAQSVLSHAT